MRVLFIQQDHVSPTGPIGDAFAAHGFGVDELLVVPEESFHDPRVVVDFPDPKDYDAVVPMGAPWSVYDHETIGSWVHDEIEFLRSAHQSGVPVLGICFGGQALACALGGQVVRADEPEIGWVTVESDAPELVAPGPWFQWHSDRWVLPSDIRPIAASAICDQAFVVDQSMGVQFHPELTPAMLDGWLDNGGDEHARAHGIDPEDLRRHTDSEAAAAERRAHALVDSFLSQVATRSPAVGGRR